MALPRSTRLVTALLAIFKSGAACMPIDPNYPSERTAYMLTDAAIRLLITDPTLPTTAPAVLILDTTEPHPEIDATLPQPLHTVTCGTPRQPRLPHVHVRINRTTQNPS